MLVFFLAGSIFEVRDALNLLDLGPLLGALQQLEVIHGRLVVLTAYGFTEVGEAKVVFPFGSIVIQVSVLVYGLRPLVFVSDVVASLVPSNFVDEVLGFLLDVVILVDFKLEVLVLKHEVVSLDEQNFEVSDEAVDLLLVEEALVVLAGAEVLTHLAH